MLRWRWYWFSQTEQYIITNPLSKETFAILARARWASVQPIDLLRNMYMWLCWLLHYSVMKLLLAKGGKWTAKLEQDHKRLCIRCCIAITALPERYYAPVFSTAMRQPDIWDLFQKTLVHCSILSHKKWDYCPKCCKFHCLEQDWKVWIHEEIQSALLALSQMSF